MKNKLLLILASLFFTIIGNAQTVSNEPAMANTFRSEGKIYVVIAVLSIIFICLVAYLISIDVKLKILEKKEL
jgi:hypothetical protein